MNGKTSGMAAAVRLVPSARARLTTVTVAVLAGACVLLAPSFASAGVADCGMLTNFASVTFQSAGYTPVEVSYAVTASIRIATPNLVISKVSTPTMQGAGGTVTFCISFQNISYCASAIDVIITDRVPDNMNFIMGAPNYTAWTNGPNNGTQVNQWLNAGVWTAGEPAIVGQYYLRWAFDQLAPRESGVICFRASVL